MRLMLISLALLGLLAACAPAAYTRPPVEPLVFEADYETLFDATLQAITTTAVPRPAAAGRLRFAVTEAARDTGLITAVHGATYDAVATARKTFGDPQAGTSFGVQVTLPLSEPRPGVLLTVVVRPAEEGRASIVYSSVTRTGAESVTGNRFMARVLERLAARFGPPL